MLEKLKNNWLIIAVLAIAFLLRFVPLFSYEFSFDELSALERTRFDNLNDLIEKGVKIDAHPALIQVFLFYWIKIGNASEVWVKLPFLVCGFLSCWFIFRFANKWFNYKTGVISAIIVGCSMIFLVYSSFARMYAPGVLFAILALENLFEITFNDSVKIRHYVLAGLFLLLGVLNNHMGALFAVLTGSIAFVVAGKKQKIYLTGMAVSAFLLYAPHLSITLTQMGYSIAADNGGWLPAPKWDACILFMKALLGTGIVVYAFIFLFIYGGTESKFSFKTDRKFLFLLLSFIGYCLVVYLYSVYKSPVLQFSVLLIASPCIIVALAYIISFIPEKIFNVTAVSLVVAFLVQTIYVKQYYKLGIKQGAKSSVTETISAKEKYGKDNVAVIYNTGAFFIEKYIEQLGAKYSYINLFDSAYKKPGALMRYFRELKEEYLVFSEADGVNIEMAKTFYPYVIKHEEGYFTNIYLLCKRDKEAVNDEAVVKTINLSNKGDFVFPDNYKRDGSDILIDSLDEFPFYVWANLDAGIVQNGQWVVCVSCYIPQKPMENLSFDFAVKQKDSLEFYSSRNFRDFYLQGDSMQHGYSSIFMGTDFRDWLDKKDKLEGYFWNQSKRRYIVKSLDLKILDINPHKYSIWD
ncbi:MAG: glycosyltransferase family 39 protein [Bacteroidia bacterium]